MGRPRGITTKTFICDGCHNYGSKKQTDYDRNATNYCSLECYRLNGCKAIKHGNIKRITYVCENPKCDIEITETQKVYDKKKNHYCNKECKKSHTKDVVEERRIANLKFNKAKKLEETFKDRWEKIKWLSTQEN